MTSLPSFIELMGSLALEQTAHSPSSDLSLSPNPSPSSSPQPGGTTMAPSRSRSSPSLRNFSSRDCAPRYSPYSSDARRGSTSCSSSSDPDSTKRRSTPPPSSYLRARRSQNQLTINIYGSTSDLPAYTPISTYLRRKTPGASPTSPGFPRPVAYVSTDIVLPILPSFSSPASTDSSSLGALQPDRTFRSQQSDKAVVITGATEVATVAQPSRIHRRWHPGIRLSAPSFSRKLDHINQHRLIPRLV
ncbi:hypothetical protein Ac2012v2_004024 [Leucoagaricus gongylophorus]